MKLIIELQYFPPVILYRNLYKFSHIEFEQYEFYNKMSFRNRCIIAGANGKISLSIPLENGREQKRLAKDVRISNIHSWQKNHWKTIESCYNKSPWFEYYKYDLHALYIKPFSYLLDWNLACFNWSIDKLKIPVHHSLSSGFMKQPVEGLADWRNKILPRNYEGFKPLKYSQVFEEKTGFLPNISILDLLFCEGKNAKNLLESLQGGEEE